MNGTMVYIPDFRPVVETIEYGAAFLVVLALGFGLAHLRRRGF